MTSRTRSLDGCWTCHLRRKKCDELRPACGGCATLEIDCLISEEKPEWMDGGEKQKEKAEWLKRDVKRKAGSRRERRFIQTLENDMKGLDTSQTTAGESLDYPMTMEDGNGAIHHRREAPMSGSSSSVYNSGFPSDGNLAIETETTTASTSGVEMSL